MGVVTDEALRDLLTEFDELTIALTPDGLVARVAGVPVATGPTPQALLAGLTLAGAIDAVVAAVNDPAHRAGLRQRGPLLKAAPDVDLYAEWSWVADNVARVGTRAQMASAGHPEAALARADAHGTSARSFDQLPGYPVPYRDGGWSANGFVVNNQQGPVRCGWLARADLAAFLQATVDGDHAAAGALLTVGG